MRAGEYQGFTGLSANSAKFALRGGRYGIDVISTAWSGGSVALQKVAGDGSTLVTVENINGSAVNFTANGYVTADLPPGTYQFTVTTATGVGAEATRIPGE